VRSERGAYPLWYRHTHWLMLFLLLLYSVTRWHHLTLLPIHFDEIVYLDRVNYIISRHDFLIGLRDDLRTGHLWAIALFWPLSYDHLWVGRFVSTLAGLFGGIGVYKVGALLFSNRRIGLIAAVFYFLSPALLFYDRMALADTLLTACEVWILYAVAFYFLKNSRPVWWVGLLVALALLTKPSGFLFLVIPVLGLLLLAKHPLLTKQVAAGVLPLIIGAGVALALMFPFLSNTQQAFMEKAGVGGGVGPVDAWERLGQNLLISTDWLVSLFSLPLIFLAVVGFALAALSKQARRPALFLVLALSVQWLFFAFVSEIWYPRYLLPLAPFIVLLAAYAIHALTKLSTRMTWKVVIVIGSVGLLWPALYTDFWLLADPSRAPLHPDESRQYITGWPSGYGLMEVSSIIRRLADEYPSIYIAYTESVMARRGLRYYLPDPPPNVTFKSFDPFEGGTIEKLNDMAASRPTFVILNTAHEKGLDDFFRNPEAFPQALHMFQVTRPGGLTTWDIYQWRILHASDHS
jgi:4-amino-4-deoxy-L-arabinose transferase-like glycosyltransferase